MKRLYFSFLLIALSAGNPAKSQCDCPWPTDVIILHVNDMHAKIDNMGKLAYLVDSLERECRHVFVVAAGDNFTGNPVVDMVSDKGYPMIDLMNRCGFDVSAFGNHEFDLGQETLNRRIRQARFPFISCNLDATDDVLKQPRAFIKRRAGAGNRIAFLGVTQIGPNGLPDSHPSRLQGLQFCEPLGTAKRFSCLKDRFVLIGITHLGLDADRQLADQMPQLDLIIGGHSHDRLDSGLTRNGVLITQTGNGLKYIGKTFLRLERGRVIYKKEEMIPFSSLTRTDPKVQKLIDAYNANEELSRVVGVAKEAIEGYPQLGSMMTDALVSATGADIAFQNRGGIRTPSFQKGEITLKDIYRLDPFGNQVVVLSMNAREIRSLICYGFGLEKCLDLEVAGMTYEVKTGKDGSCANVILRDPSGQPLDETREYKVAVNSYVSSAYRFDHRDPGTTLPLGTADALISYLEKMKEVDYTGVSRISVSAETP